MQKKNFLKKQDFTQGDEKRKRSSRLKSQPQAKMFQHDKALRRDTNTYINKASY